MATKLLRVVMAGYLASELSRLVMKEAAQQGMKSMTCLPTGEQ
jgi:hypothetical protein